MNDLTRRRLLVGGVATAAAAVIAACTRRGRDSRTAARAARSPGGDTTRPATPACGDDPTPEQDEGPFFTPNSPKRTNIREDVDGTSLVVAGTVMTTACRPVARALIDVWQADDRGEYDNEGQRLRGHLFTGDDGRYQFETVVPGLYPGRTRHIHVKVQAPRGRVLTTQVYFPGEAENDRDAIFNPALLVDLRDTGHGKAASFDFVLES